MATGRFDYQEGPDKIRPAENFSTIYPDGFVKLRIPETGTAIQTHKVQSIPSVLKDGAEKYSNRIAFSYKVGDEWQEMTYTEYYANVRKCAKAFLKLGLERYHAVCIIGFNSPEWIISCYGAIFAGGMSAGIYMTNSPEACLHCLKTSRANVCVVEDDAQLQKILSIYHGLPQLRLIVQYKGEPKDPSVYSWKQLLEVGAQEPDDLLETVLKNLAPNECCNIVFTSGTIGNPKAVMLSHDNMIWTIISTQERLRLDVGCERVVSFLPLSHVAAQMVDIYLMVRIGATLYFADRNALKGTLVNTLREVKPTRFIGVPRVYEKIREKMLDVARDNGMIKTAVASWAKAHSLEHHTNVMNGDNSSTWSYYIASYILTKIKTALGFNNCKVFYSAAAPLSQEVRQYFMSLDMPINDIYGMTEATGPHAASSAAASKLMSTGRAIPGVKTSIANPDAEGTGEICMYGRHVFMGYLGDQAHTDETIDPEGWLHSGDQGFVDDEGFIFITGRLKELLITAGGENVAPVPIEDVFRKKLPQVSSAMLVGDKKKFLSMLVTLKTEVDHNSFPLSTLTKECQEWLAQLGCPASTTQEVLAAGPHPNLVKAIQAGIDATNQVAVSNAAKVQKFRILENDFSMPTGEFGPTLKLKRNFVTKKYAKEIDIMYL